MIYGVWRRIGDRAPQHEESCHKLLATGTPLLLHSAIAESGFAALGAATSYLVAADNLSAPAVMRRHLLQRFGEVSDGRCDQGRVHPVAVRVSAGQLGSTSARPAGGPESG